MWWNRCSVLVLLLGSGCAHDTPVLPHQGLFQTGGLHPDDSSAPTDSGEPNDPGTPEPLTSDPGWSTGTPSVCTDPAPLSFTHTPDALGDLAVVSIEEFGAAALWTMDGQTYVVHTTSGRELGIRSVGFPSGIATAVELEQDLRSFLLRDVDQDGEVDLLGMGTGLFVSYSFLTPARQTEVLVEAREDRAIYDVLPVDLDSDGDLDLILGTNNNPETTPQDPLQYIEQTRPRSWNGPVDIPVGGTPATFDLATIDHNGDGILDVYVCNDQGASFGGNTLLLSDGSGNLTMADAPGLDVTTDCMGISHGDINQDGRLDTFLTALDRHWMLVADETGAYDIALASMPPLQGAQMGWGSSMVDIDNDGRTDLIVATSEFSSLEPTGHPLLYLQQLEDGTFLEVGEWVGLPTEANTRAVLTRDLNDDGIVDILASDFASGPRLLLSNGCGTANWIEVDGPAGGVVTVQAGGRTWTQLLTHTPGWSVSVQPRVHVGIGEEDSIDLVTLTLPSADGPRTVALVGPLEPNQRLRWSDTMRSE